jgi:hypothetical protein
MANLSLTRNGIVEQRIHNDVGPHHRPRPQARRRDSRRSCRVSLANGRIGDYSTMVLTSPIIEATCSGRPTNKSAMVVMPMAGRHISPPCLTDKQRRYMASHSAQ